MKNYLIKDLISIIVPIYNVSEYLEKCVSSIIQQTYNNIEIILIDDGSTDDSGKICDKFKVTDSRVKVCHKENQGLVLARKSGLDCAQGEYIVFVDGDDYIEPDMIQELYCVIEETKTDFVHSGYVKDNNEKVPDANCNEILILIDENRTRILKNYIFSHEDGKRMGHGIWGKIYKSEFIRKAIQKVPDNQSYGEDLLCICACIMECSSFAIRTEAYYHYVTRPTSITNEKKITNLVREIELYKCLYNMFCQYGNFAQMESNIQNLMKNNILYVLEQLGDKEFHIMRYLYTDIGKLFGKKVVIYGAGIVGQDYYRYIRQYKQCHVQAIVDSNYKKYHLAYVDVESPEVLKRLQYDYIIIAVKSYDVADAIKNILVESGVDEVKILWTPPCEAI